MKMEYEKTILSILERVVTLEEKVNKLESEEVKYREEETEDENKERKSQENKHNKDSIIRELRNKLQPKGIKVTKASREEGSGVIISSENDKEVKKVMLKRSRNYPRPGFEWRGWHTIEKETIDFFDGFILAVEKNGELYFFLFGKEDFQAVLSQKQLDKNEIYHFYLNKNNGGDITDDREDPEINMKKYYKNWEVLK